MFGYLKNYTVVMWMSK